jgi:nitrile hydratase
LVTRTWEDTAFKQRLLGNPRAVLQEYALSVPNSQTVQVLEDTADTMYLVLPTKPSGHFSDEELARLAGQQPEPTRKVGQVLITAWHDEAFKQRLLGNPDAVLQEHGFPLPAGKAVRVVENTAETVHLILPVKPNAELSEQELEQVTGGIVGIVVLGGAMLGIAALECWMDN